MLDEQIAQVRTGVLHFPTVLDAIVPIYNISGVSAELNLTQAAIVGIYLGRIRRWNDPEIASANKGISLPAQDIVVVHRSDGSTSSFIFTDFLSKISQEWASKVGRNSSVNWPVGLGAKGNKGVSGLVRQVPGAIGYVELIYALQNRFTHGRVQNADGVFVKAELSALTAAGANTARSMPEDFRVSITNAPGKAAYPITSYTWLLIPTTIADAARRNALKDLLKRMLNDDQAYAPDLGYAPLPKEVAQRETAAIARIK
jgi:phosphate transport system substrate-binding protein